MSMMSSSVGSHSTLHASLAYEFLLSEFLLRARVTKTEKESLSHRDQKFQKFRNIDRRILAIKITWRIVNRFEERVLASLNIMGKEGGGGRVR